jgi:hypothetical protein
MQKLELPPYVLKVITKKDPNTQQLYIPSVDDYQLKKLIELLAEHQNPYITTLKLQSGSLTNEGLAHFAIMPATIVNVYLSNHNLTAGVAPVLMQVFSHVINLDISDNHISREDAAYLVQNTQQHWLNVAGNHDLTEEDVTNIRRRTECNIEKLYNCKPPSTKLSAASRLRVSGCAGEQRQPQKNNAIAILPITGVRLPYSFSK